MYSALLAAVMPALSRLTPSRFWQIHQESLQVMTSAPEPEAARFGRLQRILRHAVETVPFYRERFCGTGLTPDNIQSFADLAKLPPLTKADLRASFPDGITSSAQLHKPWRMSNTSGTVERVSIIHDFQKRDSDRAASLTALRLATGYRLGMSYMTLPPNICRSVCGAAETESPSLGAFLWTHLRNGTWKDSETHSDLRGIIENQILYRHTQLPSYWPDKLVQPPEVLEECLGRIDSAAPHTLKGLPVYLYLLAEYILRTRRRAPKVSGAIMPMGSSITPLMKRMVEEAFGVPVAEDYGSAEMAAIASECRFRNGHHPLMPFYHVEIEKDGRPARPGELGRVLVTDLVNMAMPMIRYEIGDAAMVLPGECQCGFKGLRFEVRGRWQECLTGQDGRIISSDEFTDSILSEPGVLLFQLHMLPRSRYELQIVPRADMMPNLERVEARVHEVLDPCVGRLKVTLARNLRPEATGKFRFIKQAANLSAVTKDVHAASA